jgi:hypothetical protein
MYASRNPVGGWLPAGVSRPAVNDVAFIFPVPRILRNPLAGRWSH